jgi:transcription factor IIIB subunit 2
MVFACPNCKSRDIDVNEAGGQSACVDCGTVIEENTIVSNVEFQESGDRSLVIGQFVSVHSSKPYNANARPRNRYGNARESRDTTLATARRNISQVAGSLRLPPIYVDKAYRLYQLALQRNFIFGRRQMHVVATCLYTICRQEKSPHLLIDFSDALQVNVYVLGKSFLQFTRLLNLALPIVDPALYIHRYSARLNLGDKLNLVSTTALRLVSRFKKDWINHGRRPDGICAAAMLIAARSQGFNTTNGDIAKIFRVSGDTLRKRLQDFKRTPSAFMTIHEFHQQDSNLEFDPPIYIENQVQRYGEENVKLVSSEEGNHEKASGDMHEDPRDNVLMKRRTKLTQIKLYKNKTREDMYNGISDEVGKQNHQNNLNTDIDEDNCEIADIEVDSYLLDEAERRKRIQIRDQMYGEFMRDRARRKKEKALRESNNAATNNTDKKRSLSNGQGNRINDTQDNKRKSSRINYEMVFEAFQEDGSFVMPTTKKIA